MHRSARLLWVVVLLLAVTACRGRRRLVAAGPEGSPDGVVVGEVIESDVVEGTVVDGEFVPADGAVVADGEGFPGETPEALPREDVDPELDRMLDQAAEEAAAERDRRLFLARRAMEQAQEALRGGDIEEAQRLYERAIELDPDNVEAREALRQIAFDRGAEAGALLESARTEVEVRRQQAAVEVRGLLERGRELEARGEFEAAVREYQKALAILAWYAETGDFGVTADRVQDLIDQARYKATLAERAAREEQIRRAQREQEMTLQLERERRLGRLRAYFEQANIAFRQGEYAVAREYMRQVLRLDPDNSDAERLISLAYDAEHMRNERRFRRLFADQWKAIMQDLEFSTLPQVRTVEFPEDWLEEIAIRTPRAVGDADEDVEDASIVEMLEVVRTKRIESVNWQEAPIVDVIEYLRTITGLNFYMTPAARDAAADVPVDLQLTDVTVQTILELALEPNGLKWVPEGDVIRIAAADEVSGTLTIAYFDVKDLGVRIKNFIGEEINLTPSNFHPLEPPDLEDPLPIFDPEALPDLVRDTIGAEGTWDIDNAVIEVRNGILIVRHTKDIINQVGQLLDELRANTGILVSLEVRFLTAEDNFLRDVGVDLRGLGDDSQGVGAPGLGTNFVQDDVFFGSPGNPFGVPFGVNPEPSSVGTARDAGIFYNDGQDGAYAARVENLFDILLGNPQVLTGSGGLSFQHTFLDDTQIEVILRAVEKSERIQQITAPRVTVYNTQRANVQVLNEIAYVADYEVEIAQASNIANPVIQRIRDGVVLDVKPIVSADRRYVSLELRPTVAVVGRPIATFSTSLASGPGPVSANAPVVIQVPQVRISRVRTTVSMPDGGTLLIGGLKFYEQETLESGVPFFSNIPILKFLLTRQGHYVNRRNLLILITAEIVNLEELEPADELDVLPLPDTRFELPVRPAEPCDPCAIVGGTGVPCQAPAPSAGTVPADPLCR